MLGASLTITHMLRSATAAQRACALLSEPCRPTLSQLCMYVTDGASGEPFQQGREPKDELRHPADEARALRLTRT